MQKIPAPLPAARSSAGLTLAMLLRPERLNRVVEQEARGTPHSFSAAGMLRQLQTELFKTGAGKCALQEKMLPETELFYTFI